MIAKMYSSTTSDKEKTTVYQLMFESHQLRGVSNFYYQKSVWFLYQLNLIPIPAVSSFFFFTHVLQQPGGVNSGATFYVLIHSFS
jgi:hypothetical protein